MRIRGYAPSTPCWVELSCAEPERAAFFYAELFGWESTGDRFTLGDRAVAGVGRSVPDRPDGWLPYLSTTDVRATLARVTAAGGHCLAHPADVPGGIHAIIADPGGAALGLWQPAGFNGAQVAAEPGSMAWPDLLTDDAPGAAEFYGAAFDWLLRHEFGAGEWLTAAHDAVAGLAATPHGSRWRAAFQVADVTEAVRQCVRLGGAVASGPAELGLLCYAELIDPFGGAFAVEAPAHHPVELSVSFGYPAGMEPTFGW